ncbi:MAG TPA: AI-2E family transporter, partial [Stellaceae bacterium]|nr:AI-2E family transporter [Stellaceae bacterium]
WAAIAAAVALLAFWIGSSALSDTASLASQGGETARALLGRLLGPRGLTLFGHAYSPGEIVAAAGRSLSDLFGPDTVARLVGTGIAAIAGGFLLVVLIPYFMISGPRLVAGAIWLIPPERRRAVQSVLPKILPVLRRYLLGVLVVVGYTAIVGWIGFGAVFGLPHAALLAIAIGVLEIVPVLGPVTAAALGALAGFQHAGLGGLAGLVAFIVALRLSIDNLVGPLVLGRAARIHPVVVIFAFVTGAMLFGAIGLLLAVPVAVTLKIALQHYYAEPIAAPRAER